MGFVTGRKNARTRTSGERVAGFVVGHVIAKHGPTQGGLQAGDGLATTAHRLNEG